MVKRPSSYLQLKNQQKQLGVRRNSDSTWDRHASRFRFKAESPTGAIPPIVRTAARIPCLMLQIGPVTRWRFHTRSQRDQFVHLFRDRGAVSTGRT